MTVVISSLGRDLMPQWYDDNTDYGTTPTYATAWWGLDGEAEAKASLDRLTRFIAAWPKPGPGQGVRADALLGALRQLEPLATKIAKLSVGAKKGSYSGAGYLTGKTITDEDRAAAGGILYEINDRLPKLLGAPVEPWLLVQIKERAHHILKVGTDLDLNDTTADKVSRYFASLKEAIIELPQTISKAGDAVSKVGWSLIPTWVKIGVPVAGVLLIYGLYKVGKAAAPVVATRYGLRGLGRARRRSVRRRRRSGCGCNG